MKRILSALLVVILSGAPARAVEFTREQAGRIAKSVGDLLDRAHYKGSPMNDAVAEMQELTESRIEWGRLPERVRELVLQGRRDRVSTIYERLTREYYKRLAEEASR